MSRVKIENEQLVVTIQGARKFFAVKSELSICLSNVTGVTTDFDWKKDAPKLFKLEKHIGTDFYGFYFGGKFKQQAGKVFYDLKKKEDAVVISLKDTDFDVLIIGVDDPDATVALIEQALEEQGKG